MIALRCLGVLIISSFIGKLALLITTDGVSEKLTLVPRIGFDALVAIALFLFPDRIALALSRRLGDRFAAYALAFAGILFAIQFTNLFIRNFSSQRITRLLGEEFAEMLGARTTPADLAIQAGGITCGILMVLFAKNIAEWTDLEYRRQKAWEDAQR